jgi:Zn finger protein HypA/HybF involved in hydrogenase expression
MSVSHEYRLTGYYYFIYLEPTNQSINQSIHVKMNHFHYQCKRVLKQEKRRSWSTVDSKSYSLVQTLKEDHSQNDHVRRYCRVCREALKSDAKYFVCEKCHRELILAEDDRNYIEHSRLHY